MADKATDLVISYAVRYDGTVKDSYAPLQKALDDGYRVIDVFTNAASSGGASNSPGTVVVTVLLTSGKDSAYWRTSPRQGPTKAEAIPMSP